MGLNFKFNTAALEASMMQVADRAYRGASEKMRRKAISLRDLARQYAPVDDGDLRDAIDYMTVKDANRRNSFVVFVDPDAVANPKSGKLVGEYALLIERGLRPYGDGSVPGVSRAGGETGGRFMKRAYDQILKGMTEDIAGEVRRIVGGGRAILPSNQKMMSQRDYGDDE